MFWSLKASGKLHSIQITSNSPVLPWELVRPESGRRRCPDGFLGISYRLARWAPRSTAGQVDRPLNRMPFTGVATVAPAYDNNLELPFQQVEVDALSKLAGFRLIGGDFGSFEKMVGEVSTGFIHFSGHGEVNDPGTGAPVFAIRLARPGARPDDLAGADLRAARQGQSVLLLQRLRHRPRRVRWAASCRAGGRRCWPAARPASSAACGR